MLNKSSSSRIDSSFSGALLIDKPSGVTSAEVVRVIKKQTKLKKVGHAGTLDPLATGLLVVLCGKASRLQDLFLNANKTYEALILIGQGTDTDDIDGKVLFQKEIDLLAPHIKKEDTEAQLKENFYGQMLQVPPRFSAIKKDGQPLYKKARKGEDFEVDSRLIEIHSSKFQIVSSNSIECQISCSKGTYIRSIARDVGQLLGSYGCIAKLRRISSGDFKVSNAVTLEDFSKHKITSSSVVSLEELADDFRSITVNSRMASDLKVGKQAALANIPVGDVVDTKSFAALWSDNRELLGFLESNISAEGLGWKIRFMVAR